MRYALDETQYDFPKTSYEQAYINPSKKLIYSILSKIKEGSLTVYDGSGLPAYFGENSNQPVPISSAVTKPSFNRHPIILRISNERFFERLCHGGPIALGESYMDGDWNIDEDRLVDFFQVLFQNQLEDHVKENLSMSLRLILQRLISSPRSLINAKRNVQHHYDLGNNFYEQMLDTSMAYSCGYQLQAEDTLEQMQQQKYQRIAAKLGLSRGGSLLDIGCGWGGMLIYAARKFPHIRGHGVTLSSEQYRFAKKRIEEEGLDKRIKIELKDYRLLSGSFDFIVSVGMFEHVGKASYQQFMDKSQKLLNPGGVGLLHTIGDEEAPTRPQDPWINRYIFPGSRLPRIEEIASSMRKAKLSIGHIENWRPHYARTLQKWRNKFRANEQTIRNLGKQFDDRFIRMWNFYLQSCEACFIDSTVELYQVLFCRREKWSFPLFSEFK